ncbi:hypothetical protein EJ04DRAFT_504678 [Polyplosphaeria fusca]|uniref:Rhodopsin domain-containing protein n=1 Tax=Polyplosphaeria fusca TaxID=682080 RepID=A0A9P4UVB7_9PLEO|nr:hypothetical protein EJ04DRAFT_504678 [Polyplosphaeria fusca]
MVKWGSGVHQWQITLGQLFNQLYWANAGEVIYSPAIFLVKMAILTQYLRLFAPSRSLNRIMWYGAWATIISSFIFYVIQMFWTLLYCKPRRMIWDKLTPGGKCQDHTPIVFSQGMFSIVSDVVILLLPTSSLWKLRVPMARKVVITILFATGLLAIAAAGMRIFFTAKIKPVISKADVSYYGLFIGLWTEAEIALGFIVACALSVPRLIQAKRNNLNRAVSYVVTPIRSATGTLHSRSRSWSHSRNRSSSKGSKSSNSRTSQRNIEDGVEPKILHGVMDSKAPEMSVADIGAISSESSSIYSKGESLNILPEIKQLERIDEEMLIMRNFDFDFESGRH